MSKNSMDILEKWITDIKTDAKKGSNCAGTYSKDVYFQRIIGQCDAILTTVECCNKKE